MARRRTRYEIYADLLDIVARRGSCRLTRASYGANLPVDRAKKSLGFLASRGFVKEENVDDSIVYKINKRGLEYLETFKHMRKLFAALNEEIPAPREPLDELRLESRPRAEIHVRLALKAKEAKVGEDVDIEIGLINRGEGPAKLIGIDELLPESFEIAGKPQRYRFEYNSVNLGGKVLDSQEAEEIRLTLRASNEGTYTLKPRINYEDGTGYNVATEPRPVTIRILETDIPGRVSTGYNDLDELLFGGIPEGYSIILTSISCDEKDILVKRFLESGVKMGQTTFFVTNEASGVKNMVEDHQSSLYLFLCNPQADTIIKSLPNVFKLKGVENLTNINIALNSAYRRLDNKTKGSRRACLEIISDVLLQHHAIQTRRWLTGLLPELRSKGFTTLAVMNPQMHPSEEVQAIIDLFEGEMNIYEKETKRGSRKHLRIRKMYNQRYLESEMALRKAKLQT